MNIKGFDRANSGRFSSSLNEFLIPTIIFFIQKAQMPMKQAKRKLQNYDHEKMAQAVKAIKSGAMSIWGFQINVRGQGVREDRPRHKY